MNLYDLIHQVDVAGGRQVKPDFKYPPDTKIDVDMWELENGTRLLFCINNKYLEVFTHSPSTIKVSRIKLYLNNFKVRLNLSELKDLPETKKCPWWLYGLS